jgi:hypothetical protein
LQEFEFQYYTNNRSNSFIEDGNLNIRPTLTADDFGEYFLYTGSLDLHERYGRYENFSSQLGERERKKNNINKLQSIFKRMGRDQKVYLSPLTDVQMQHIWAANEMEIMRKF